MSTDEFGELEDLEKEHIYKDIRDLNIKTNLKIYIRLLFYLDTKIQEEKNLQEKIQNIEQQMKVATKEYFDDLNQEINTKLEPYNNNMVDVILKLLEEEGDNLYLKEDYKEFRKLRPLENIKSDEEELPSKRISNIRNRIQVMSKELPKDVSEKKQNIDKKTEELKQIKETITKKLIEKEYLEEEKNELQDLEAKKEKLEVEITGTKEKIKTTQSKREVEKKKQLESKLKKLEAKSQQLEKQIATKESEITMKGIKSSQLDEELKGLGEVKQLVKELNEVKSDTTIRNPEDIKPLEKKILFLEKKLHEKNEEESNAARAAEAAAARAAAAVAKVAEVAEEKRQAEAEAARAAEAATEAQEKAARAAAAREAVGRAMVEVAGVDEAEKTRAKFPLWDAAKEAAAEEEAARARAAKKAAAASAAAADKEAAEAAAAAAAEEEAATAAAAAAARAARDEVAAEVEKYTKKDLKK